MHIPVEQELVSHDNVSICKYWIWNIDNKSSYYYVYHLLQN